MQKDDRSGQIALKKARVLNKLIEKLQNTTIGSLQDDVSSNTNEINNIYNTLTFMENQISAISSVLGITYNPDGTMISEQYSNHAHDYEDTIIPDTADGSGVEQTTEKETSGVSS